MTPRACAPASELVDRPLLVGEMVEGEGGETAPFSRGTVCGDRYIRHTQNMNQNSKTFPQKLSIIAQRHALTKIHLHKAGRVSLCTSTVMGNSEGSSPFPSLLSAGYLYS